jgi:MYXO-CTERM domain-containing protein
VALVATDVDGDMLTYTVVSGPANGTLTGTGANQTYTPNADFHGTDSFTYRANDGALDSNTATVTLTVTAVNDAPVAQAVSATTNEDTPVAVALQATDVDGDTLAYTVVSGPAHGTLTGTPPDLTYTPSANFHGTDSFTFQVNDGTADSAVITATVTVQPVNDTPAVEAISLTTPEDTALSFSLQGGDADGDTLAYTVVSGPAHGTLTGTPPALTYTPNANFAGADSFTYKASDGTAESSTATVTVTVEPVNDAPVAQALTLTTAAGRATPVMLAATDVDSTSLAYMVVSQPAHGTLSGAPPALTYTSNPNFSGSDSFTYKASDGLAESAEVTVSITVTPAPEPGGCGCAADAESGWDAWAMALGLLGLGFGLRRRSRYA